MRMSAPPPMMSAPKNVTAELPLSETTAAMPMAIMKSGFIS